MKLEIRQYNLLTLIDLIRNDELKIIGKPEGSITYGNIHTATEVLLSIFGRTLYLPALNIVKQNNISMLYDDGNKITDLYKYINQDKTELAEEEMNKLLDTVFAASITDYDVTPRVELKAEEVMAVLGISRQTLSNYVKRGLIKTTETITGRYVYDADSVYKLKEGK